MKTLSIFLAASSLAFAQQKVEQQDVDKPTTAVSSPTIVKSTQHALIVCGHPGDEEHRVLFAETVSRIRRGLIDNYKVDSANVTVLFGVGPVTDGDAGQSTKNETETDVDATDDNEDDETTVEENIDVSWLQSKPAATRENLEQEVAKLAKGIKPQDSLWVMTIGHAHFEKGRSWFNLPGPDLQQTQFAKLFEKISAKRQWFFLTTPVSGYYVKPLSRTGRVVISATESDLEINETLFPHALADVLNKKPADLVDFDEDGTISLLDFHLNVTRNIADRYFDGALLATEHAQIDDNGDKRATEIQRHFLPEDHGGLPPSRQRKTLSKNSDGHIASGIKFADAAKKTTVEKQQADSKASEEKTANTDA